MSLYHQAAEILTTATEQGGSLKSIIFGKKDWKTDRKILFALSTESAKWSEVLSEVIEKAELLKAEKQLTPILSLVLAHDLLLAKKGVALPAKHGLHTTIARHRARLTSELTKARLRRGCASIQALREHVNTGTSAAGDGYVYAHPRWVRINTIHTSLDKELETTFEDFTSVSALSDITSSSNGKLIYADPNIPNLIAVPGNVDLSSTKACKDGRMIFQEKASCFPAFLLDPASKQGDVIDACAAPGNKTTHLAALVNSEDGGGRRKIFACEKDPMRSQTLEKMVKLAGAADVVTVRATQDFLKLDPHAATFENVESLLLDPSCSGSGIMGRDEASVTIHLPSRDNKQPETAARGKKRKRGGQPQQAADIKVKLETSSSAPDRLVEEEAAPTQADGEDAAKLATRLAALSGFQLRLLEHAMAFPSAKRITYSTCSLHKEENEAVVVRALSSDVARERRWTVLRRGEQVEGMKSWGLRGSLEAVDELREEDVDAEEVVEACLRCEKGGDGGTMGFFVCGFVRDGVTGAEEAADTTTNGHMEHADESEGEWEGFGDDS